jgi:hypothetical protein
VITRLTQQVKDFDRLVKAAIEVIKITDKLCVDYDWGPLLTAAFPDASGVVTSDSQRLFLKALVGNSKLWDPTNGNAYKWFKQAGLPYDCKACAKLV